MKSEISPRQQPSHQWLGSSLGLSTHSTERWDSSLGFPNEFATSYELTVTPKLGDNENILQGPPTLMQVINEATGFSNFAI